MNETLKEELAEMDLKLSVVLLTALYFSTAAGMFWYMSTVGMGELSKSCMRKHAAARDVWGHAPLGLPRPFFGHWNSVKSQIGGRMYRPEHASQAKRKRRISCHLAATNFKSTLRVHRPMPLLSQWPIPFYKLKM